MCYFFILGSNPTLSIAELSAVFGLYGKDTKCPACPAKADGGAQVGRSVSNGAFILDTANKIDAQQTIKTLGGTVKIGVVRHELPGVNHEEILKNVLSMLGAGKIKGKFKFGFSYYGKAKFNTQKLAMEIKRYLRDNKISCRWVTSREPTLSSVVVEQNKLTSGGVEITLIENNKLLLIGQTLAVQPFKELSFRDYGRPARDDRSGMLPPKLAQIMINLSQAKLSGAILDPFCGSGTILTEAMLMGHKNVIGIDISVKAIQNSEKNIKWTSNKFQIPSARDFQFQLFNKDSTKLSKFIKSNSIDAIVTEPYLGPQRGKFNVDKIVKELEILYSKSLTEFKKVLKTRGRIVMIWPTFRVSHNSKYLKPDLSGFKIVNPIPGELRNHKIIKLTNRNTIVYGRKDQKIWREIVVLLDKNI